PLPGQRRAGAGEAAPVVGGEPEALDGVAVLAAGVAGVPLPAVAGVADGQQAQQVVAGGLGDDGGAGDGIGGGVALDDGRVGADGGGGAAVEEGGVVVAGGGRRPPHRQVGGVVDVDAVDLGHRGGADGDGDGLLADQRRQPLSLGRGQLLAVAHPGDPAAVR